MHSDSVHDCKETSPIALEILHANSDAGASPLFDRGPMALPYVDQNELVSVLPFTTNEKSACACQHASDLSSGENDIWHADVPDIQAGIFKKSHQSSL